MHALHLACQLIELECWLFESKVGAWVGASATAREMKGLFPCFILRKMPVSVIPSSVFLMKTKEPELQLFVMCYK